MVRDLIGQACGSFDRDRAPVLVEVGVPRDEPEAAMANGNVVSQPSDAIRVTVA
jgi:hypothetical protein